MPRATRRARRSCGGRSTSRWSRTTRSSSARLRCDDPDLIANAYRSGTPMGGALGPVLGNQSPRFLVLAMKDPGTAGAPGIPLQRIQIVKGWLDAGGQTHERVFEVAGDRANGAGVDPGTCEPTGTGFSSLCIVWQDPDFDRAERAFYYARVVENPTCRWSARLCNDLGVDCAGSVPAEYATCCDPRFPKTIQERAVTSPIWYRPEAIARLKGKIKFGPYDLPGGDRLKLAVRLGAVPAAFDVDAHDLELRLSDDDVVYAVTLPAGTLVRTGPTHWLYRDKSGTLGGIVKASFKVRSNGEGLLKLATRRIDLSAAAPEEHPMSVRLAVGTYESSHTRTWTLHGGALAASSR